MENMNSTTVARGRGRGRGRDPKLSILQMTSNAGMGRGRGRGIDPKLLLQQVQKNQCPKNVSDLPVNPMVSSVDTDSCRIQDKCLVTTRHVINWESTSETPSDYSDPDVASFTTKSRGTVVSQASKPEETPSLTKYTPSIESELSTTPPQVVPVPRKRGQVTISQYLPKYFNAPKPSNRLKTLGSAEVKILKVLDKPGYLMVAFQDTHSVERFRNMLKQMASFYTTPEGFTLRKYGHSLENGEIVAATVCSCSDESVFRRVKIQNIQVQENDFIRAHAVDIDNLSHWNIICAFSLLESFYQHPSQACRIKISNYTDLYPKGIFELLFPDPKTFLGVMNRLAHTIFASMVGHSIAVSNIASENDNECLSVEVNLDINLRLEALFVEAFCNYFTPVVPEEGVIQDGVITDILQSGKIGICLKDSLASSITQILNSLDMQQLAQNVTEEDKNELYERIRTRNCRLCIALDTKTSRLCRVKINSYNYGDKFRLGVTFMDTGRDTVITVSDLVCGITNNPKIPAILGLLPAQALQFQLKNSQYLTETECNEIFQKYNNGVKFKVFKNFKIRDSALQVKLFNTSYI